MGLFVMTSRVSTSRPSARSRPSTAPNRILLESSASIDFITKLRSGSPLYDPTSSLGLKASPHQLVNKGNEKSEELEMVFDPYKCQFPVQKISLSKRENSSTFPQSSLLSVPCVIREILKAPPCPNDVIAKLLEVALTHHNTSHYQLAIQTYIKAQDCWLEAIEAAGIEEMSLHEIIYFRMAIGNVYESCANDELALSEYIEAKRYAEIGLSDDHPDRAVPYSAIGSVYVHLGQISLARDYFAKGHEIRKAVLGDRHVDTLILKNNVAVCWHIADKINVALNLYEECFGGLKEKLGLSHPRTILVQRNITKAKQKAMKDFVLNMPELRPIAFPGMKKSDSTESAPVKKKKKKKKKK